MRYGKTIIGFACLLACSSPVLTGKADAETLIPSADIGAYPPNQHAYNLNVPLEITPYFRAHLNERDTTQPLYSPLNDPRRTDYQVTGGVAYEITEKLLGQLEYQWHENVTSRLGLGEPQTTLQFDRSGFSLDGFNVDLTYKLQ